MVTRDIELESKGIRAIKNWLASRSQSVEGHLFVNRYGEPILERGVRKLVTKYRLAAGITRRASEAFVEQGRQVTTLPVERFR